MIITIDGGAGTGKTTVAARVASALKFHYFDTGALYRCFAWFCLEHAIDVEDLPRLLSLLPQFIFEIQENGEKKRYFVGGKDVSEEIRSRSVTAYASQVSTYQEIRHVLLKTQRDFAQGRNAVFEGRDLGTVVFPHAEYKIFLTADPLVRAKRRLAEMRARGGEEISEEELHREMQARDAADSLRAVAPLRPAEGAYFIDTTTLSIDEVVERIVQYVKRPL